MNQDNYASLEASKRLVDAGIVLETDCVWRKKRGKTGYYLSRKALYHRTTDIPAPCMAEVWRELPEFISAEDPDLEEPGISYLNVQKTGPYTDCGYDFIGLQASKDNPTDALIDLLIWVRKEAKV